MLLPGNSLVLGVPTGFLERIFPNLAGGVSIFTMEFLQPNLSTPPCCHATPRPNGLQAPGESTCNDWMSFQSLGGACYNAQA